MGMLIKVVWKVSVFLKSFMKKTKDSWLALINPNGQGNYYIC